MFLLLYNCTPFFKPSATYQAIQFDIVFPEQQIACVTTIITLLEIYIHIIGYFPFVHYIFPRKFIYWDCWFFSTTAWSNLSAVDFHYICSPTCEKGWRKSILIVNKLEKELRKIMIAASLVVPFATMSHKQNKLNYCPFLSPINKYDEILHSLFIFKAPFVQFNMSPNSTFADKKQ